MIIVIINIQHAGAQDQEEISHSYCFRFEGASLRTTRPSVAYTEVKLSQEGGKTTPTTTTKPSISPATTKPFAKTTKLPPAGPFTTPVPTTISRKGGEWL